MQVAAKVRGMKWEEAWIGRMEMSTQRRDDKAYPPKKRKLNLKPKGRKVLDYVHKKKYNH